jgi:hypothetical protein
MCNTLLTKSKVSPIMIDANNPLKADEICASIRKFAVIYVIIKIANVASIL